MSARTARVSLTLLRRIAGLSQHRLARSIDVDVRVIRAIEAGKISMSSRIAEALRTVLSNRRTSDMSLSLLDSIDDWARSPTAALVEQTPTNLTRIESLLSDISGKLSALASGNPGYDLKAVINRLEDANTCLREIAYNTKT